MPYASDPDAKPQVTRLAKGSQVVELPVPMLEAT